MQTTTLTLLAVSLFAASTAQPDSFGNRLNTFDIKLVTIGNPGKTAETTYAPNTAGKIDYIYRIAKHIAHRPQRVPDARSARP